MTHEIKKGSRPHWTNLHKITSKANFVAQLKVSKSFLKLHCPKNERNIRQNSAQESGIGQIGKIIAFYALIMLNRP